MKDLVLVMGLKVNAKEQVFAMDREYVKVVQHAMELDPALAQVHAGCFSLHLVRHKDTCWL